MSGKQTPQTPIPPLQFDRPASQQPPPDYSRPGQTGQRQQSTPNYDPMFDHVVHSQGGMPHLVQYLESRYRAYIAEVNLTRQSQNQPLVDVDASLRAARPVLEYMTEFLRAHRPVEIFAIDRNYGIVLDTNDRVALCPGVYASHGSMQASGAVQISEGRSQQGQDGVVQMNDFRVIQ